MSFNTYVPKNSRNRNPKVPQVEQQVTLAEYEAVCKNTKIVTQRAVMGAHITDIDAQKLYKDKAFSTLFGVIVYVDYVNSNILANTSLKTLNTKESD